MDPDRTFSDSTDMRTLREAQRGLWATSGPFTETTFANGFVSLGMVEASLDGAFCTPVP